jgi:hypothetical protein
MSYAPPIMLKKAFKLGVFGLTFPSFQIELITDRNDL